MGPMSCQCLKWVLMNWSWVHGGCSAGDVVDDAVSVVVVHAVCVVVGAAAVGVERKEACLLC